MVLRSPQAPQMEISFYFAEKQDADAYSDIVLTLLETGAQLTGSGYAFEGDSIRTKPFEGIYDYSLTAVEGIDEQSLRNSLTDPDLRVFQIGMKGASGIVGEINEIVSYIRISEQASHSDNHPVSILSEGDFLCGPLGLTGKESRLFLKKAQRMGRQVYNRFIMLCNKLSPSYAAIMVERALICPTDLRVKNDSFCFHDFYINTNNIPLPQLAHIQKLYPGIYQETLPHGQYFSSTAILNPEGKHLENASASKMSMEVSRLIGKFL